MLIYCKRGYYECELMPVLVRGFQEVPVVCICKIYIYLFCQKIQDNLKRTILLHARHVFIHTHHFEPF
jgi:hypothetical protein